MRGSTARWTTLLVAPTLLLAACGTGADLVFEGTEATTAPDSTATSEVAEAAEAAAFPTTDAPPSEPARSLTMSFTGDTLAHSPLWRRANDVTGGTGYDFFPMFSDIAPTIARADVATCHLETPIAPVGEAFTTDPLYGVPPQIVSAMATAGYDRCSTASNHVLDRGVGGIDRTVEVLLEHGMGQAGMARNELEGLPEVFDVDGVQIGHLSYTYATNGIPIPRGEPWRTNLIDPMRIIHDATTARDLGADVVVVSLHWGTEKMVEPNDQQLIVAEQLTASGTIDLLVGHHAHVLQPIREVNGVWVAYGLGNILSNLPVNDAWPASSQDAAIVEFQIDVDDAGNVSIEPPTVIPTWVDKRDGWVIRDVQAELARQDLDPARRAELQASLDRTASVLGDYIG